MRKILRGFRCAALVGAALLGVVSARAAVYENVEYYDPVAKQKKTAYCRIILPDDWGGMDPTLYTDWYAVKGKFTSAVTTMRINGSVKLILCDDAELTVNGQGHAAIELFEGKNVDGVPNSLTIYGQSAGNGRLVANGGESCAGIGSSANVDKPTAGELIVNGGIVVANGSRSAAGIGGANCFDGNSRSGYGNGGRVEINGGQVTATGGIYNGWYGAGIGGALRGCSGDIIIRGGTVRAICSSVDGYGIGGGPEAGSDHPSSLTILGGSVNARTPEGFAKNANKDPLQCVKVSCSDLNDPLTIEGIANYGSRDIYKDGDYVYLWLPNGNHKFTLSDARMARLYQVKVDGAPVTVGPATVGLRVNDTDVNQGTSDNWTYDVRNNVLNINSSGVFYLDGQLESDAPQVSVNASGATVVLRGVKLVANNRPALVVQDGVSATLQMKDASTLSATGGSSAMKVDGTLTVDLAGDANPDTSKINVSSDGSNAVTGGGTLTINDGTFCAQATSAAIGLGVWNFVLGQNMLMKAGTSSTSANYRSEFKDEAYVLVAPSPTGTAYEYLQSLIDKTASSGTLVLEQKTYLPATVNKPITIRAATGAWPVVDGLGSERCLTVTASGVTIEGLIFKNGTAGTGDGGAVLGSGASSCRFERCRFEGNSAKNGGAVAKATAFASLFIGNTASAAGGGAHDAKIYSCTFDGCKVGGSTTANGSGANASCAVYDSLFCNCKCAATTAEYAYEIARDRLSDTYEIKDEYADQYHGSDDRAQDYGEKGVPGYNGRSLVSNQGGKRVFVAGCNGFSLSLQKLIDATSAGGTCTVPAGTYSPATIPSGKAGLKLVGAGAGETIVDGQTLVRCLLVEAKNVTIEGIAFKSGYAAADDEGGCGGGVLGSPDKSASLTVRNCTFTDCSAVTGGGGAYNVKNTENCAFVTCSSARGGGVKNTSSVGDSIISNCTFTGCSASAYGGGVQGAGQEVEAGAGKSVIEECTFTKCTAKGGGGCDYICTVNHCIFDSCSVTDKGGGLNDCGSVTGCTFTDCTSDVDGGGIRNVLTTEGCTIKNCNAAYGGGLMLPSEKNYKAYRVIACSFENCIAADRGGGVYGGGSDSDNDDDMIVRDCTFARCGAVFGGGCHYVSQIEGSTFKNCTVTEDGGAILGGKKAVRCWIEGCEAGGWGGGVGRNYDLRASLLRKNSAGEEGGGCFNTEASSCTFVGNYAPKYPAVEPGDVPARNCIFCSNKYEGGVNCHSAQTTDFCDYSHGDFHLSIKSDNAKTYVGKLGTGDDVDDLDGIPLVTFAGEKTYFYAGCYAFLPEPAQGMTVTVADNKLHPKSYVQMSLADVMALVGKDPKAYADGNKRCVVDFSDALKAKDVITIDLVQACIEVPATNGYTIVLQPPSGKRLVIDGAGKWRALHVAAGGSLEVNNVEFRNCLADGFGTNPAARTTSGGAILNDGTLAVNGCVFTGNSACAGSGTLSGGALMNCASATVTCSTFTGNEAAKGGAICNEAPGQLTVVNSTFTGNRAVKGSSGGTLTGLGGAIAQTTDAGKAAPETLLVNCTFTGNAADGLGGAIYAAGGEDGYALRLVNTIAVGNTGEPDVWLASNARGQMFSTWYGTRTTAGLAADGQWYDKAIEGAKGPVDVFAKVADGGATAVPTEAGGGQVTFPLVSGLETGAKWVRHDDVWANVQVGDERDGSVWTTVRTTSKYSWLLPPMTPLNTDQLGREFAAPVLGATSETAGREVGPEVPDEEADPCRIKSVDEEVVREAFRSLNLKPAAYAKDGVVTVTFDETVTGETVNVTAPLDLTGFTNAALVVKGPITFEAWNASRLFFIGEGNCVTFEEVMFSDGNGSLDEMGAGGAILGLSCELTCADCAFADCSAGAGGAICMGGDDCVATFTRCTFTGNEADVGDDIYRDGGSRFVFRDCTLDPDGVWERLAAEVVREEAAENGVSDYFSRVNDAMLQGLKPGNAIFWLNSDAQGTLKGAMEEFARDMPSWYTVREVGSGFVVELNGQATPKLDGKAAVDLTGSEKVVSIVPDNVKPGLTYGLGRSETPTGPYVVEDGGWVQADANGNLPKALTAPKEGASGYYKVIAK